jgi:hypothetical protein
MHPCARTHDARTRVCTHSFANPCRHDSTLTVPKTAKTSEELDGDLAISRQALCKALQETLLAEDTVQTHTHTHTHGTHTHTHIHKHTHTHTHTQ